MSSSRPSGVRARTPVVLVVDDHDDSREMYTEYLSFLGAGVIAARDGEEGLRVAIAARPRLILLDLAMPRMNGLELARRLRADPRTRHARIVALSGFGDTWRDVAVDAGCDAFLPKPTSLENLEATVRALLPELPPRRKCATPGRQ